METKGGTLAILKLLNKRIDGVGRPRLNLLRKSNMVLIDNQSENFRIEVKSRTASKSDGSLCIIENEFELS